MNSGSFWELKPFPSPAPRVNRGVGKPRAYMVDPNRRSDLFRICRFCGQINTGLIKFGLRAYAHERCFVKKYGSFEDLQRKDE